MTPWEETLGALHDLVKMGKVRYLGASSMMAWEFSKALHLQKMNGWGRFVSMQDSIDAIGVVAAGRGVGIYRGSLIRKCWRGWLIRKLVVLYRRRAMWQERVSDRHLEKGPGGHSFFIDYWK